MFFPVLNITNVLSTLNTRVDLKKNVDFTKALLVRVDFFFMSNLKNMLTGKNKNRTCHLYIHICHLN